MNRTPPTVHRFRLNRGFGRQPRFVYATSAIAARLTLVRLLRVVP